MATHIGSERCFLCKEEQARPLYTLRCGHGAPNNRPMHRSCMRAFFNTQIAQGQVPGVAYLDCPVCGGALSPTNIEQIMG